MPQYQYGNLHIRYSRSVSHSQSKLWPPQWKSWQIQPCRPAVGLTAKRALSRGIWQWKRFIGVMVKHTR